MIKFEWPNYDYDLKELTDQVIAAKRSREDVQKEIDARKWLEHLEERGMIEVLPLNGILTIT
jgi:hypothetical protein